MSTKFMTAGYWHERAKEAFALADRAVDLETKGMLVREANSYEGLAQRAKAHGNVDAGQSSRVVAVVFRRDAEIKKERDPAIEVLQVPAGTNVAMKDPTGNLWWACVS
jgi:hypothetical protein